MSTSTRAAAAASMNSARKRVARMFQQRNNQNETTSQRGLVGEDDGDSDMSLSTHRTYEGLPGGVPCPSCNGSGLIPGEMENQLVALIPVNDKRLKPRRTTLYVVGGVSTVIVIFALAGFFLLPREVTVTGKPDEILVIDILEHKKNVTMVFTFLTHIEVTNSNYYAVTVTNVTSLLTNLQIYPYRTVGHGFNTTQPSIHVKSDDQLVYVNNTVKLERDSTNLCDGQFFHMKDSWLRIRAEYTVTIEHYWGHHEQHLLRVEQPLCCNAIDQKCNPQHRLL